MTGEISADIVGRSEIEKSFAEDEYVLLEKWNEGAIILIDKPQGWTSFDVVNKIKKTFRIKKVGHAGTLDPMATGLLIVCTAKKTKEIDSFVGLDKIYTGVVKLGETTPSYDAETDVIERKPFHHITESMLHDAVTSLTGVIDQTPPMFSAIKKNGKPLYKLARKGIEIERKPRSVIIHEFTITSIDLPYVSFRIRCSKGTYIRAIAYDLGDKLGAGGHLTELRRTAIGALSVDDAATIDQLNELIDRLKRKFG